MRTLSWILSLLIHAAAAVVLVSAVGSFEPEDLSIIDVELTEVEPEPAPMPMPAPVPAPVASMPAPSKDPLQARKPGLPADKTVVLTRKPPPLLPTVSDSAPAPAEIVEPEPGVKDISPTPAPTFSDESEEGVHHIQMDAVAHRGAEARFGRMMFADYYSYSPDEFAGQFRVEGDRVVTIIDARNTAYGRFLIYDSYRGELRRLKKFNKYIYTIGPSLDKDEPVTGSVTFLAKDDRIERFIYLPDGEKGLFPSKIHFREEKVRVATGKAEVDGIVTLPPTKGTYPGVVLLHGSECIPPALVQGAVRALGMHGTVLMAFSPQGCGQEGVKRAPDAAGDAVKVLENLRKHPEVGNSLSGYLGVGEGCAEAVRATLLPGSKPDFLICLPEARGAAPDLKQVARLGVPSLWIVPSGRAWRSFRSGLETLRDKRGKPVTVVVDDLEKAPSVVPGNKGDVETGEAGSLVQAVSAGHASLAASWIAGLKAR